MKHMIHIYVFMYRYIHITYKFVKETDSDHTKDLTKKY